MNIAIYQTVNAHAPAIHWWLAQDPRFGPQLYMWLANSKEDLTSIVEEMREPTFPDQDISAELYDVHQETLREMENKKAVDGIVDCTSTYFNFTKNYKHPVWSNYFGATYDPMSTIACDKLIFAESTIEDSVMYYVTQYAFNNLDLAAIEEHSKIWWEDHKLMAGKVLDSWKEIWYRDYHNQCIQDFHDGKLQYMWQLNFAHWDLHHALVNGLNGFVLNYSMERLFNEKYQQTTSDLKAEAHQIKYVKDNNIDHLCVGTHWFNNIDTILSYLGVENSDILIQSAEQYKKEFIRINTAYKEILNKYYKGN